MTVTAQRDRNKLSLNKQMQVMSACMSLLVKHRQKEDDITYLNVVKIQLQSY